MSITSEIEEKMGLKIENLNAVEKQTYFNMLDEVKKAELTPDKLREYIVQMRIAVEDQLIREPEFIRIFVFRVENRNQILLKARLQNYILLESFLMSSERARQQLEDVVQGLVGR